MLGHSLSGLNVDFVEGNAKFDLYRLLRGWMSWQRGKRDQGLSIYLLQQGEDPTPKPMPETVAVKMVVNSENQKIKLAAQSFRRDITKMSCCVE